MAATTEPTKNGAGMRSGELAAEVVQDLNRLVSLEVALAKQELKELATTNGIAAACFAVAGVLAILALLVALPVLVVVAVPWHWQAALVWAVAYILIAGGLALYGRARLKAPMPQKTITSLKETKEWALRRMKSAGK
jgi:cytochrome c biogenesis protein CcdA